MLDWSLYDDVHTHRLDAGARAIINLPSDAADVPEQGSYSVGIHPWDTSWASDADMDRVRRLAQSPRVVAVGEAGLDARQGAPLDVQERIFRQHAALAEDLGKPLIIHAVHTYQRLIELKRELQPAVPWLIHGFRGKPQLAQSLVRAGFHISLGIKHNPDAVAVIPAHLLHHETDTEEPLP